MSSGTSDPQFPAVKVPGASIEPPAVRVERTRWEGITDIVAIAALTFLLVTRTCPAGLEQYAFGAIVLIGCGAQALQMLGKGRGGFLVPIALASGKTIKIAVGAVIGAKIGGA